MLAGRKLVETLLVYFRVPGSAELSTGIDLSSVQAELDEIAVSSENAQGEISGSDSEPSADNMEEEELVKVVPLTSRPKPVIVQRQKIELSKNDSKEKIVT